jgi:hypothetical protein
MDKNYVEPFDGLSKEEVIEFLKRVGGSQAVVGYLRGELKIVLLSDEEGEVTVGEIISMFIPPPTPIPPELEMPPLDNLVSWPDPDWDSISGE